MSNGSTQINVVDCIPKPLDKQFRVRYVWLNALGISYLVANYFDKNLIQLLGNSPIVYQSTILSTVKEIVDKFGYREPLDDEKVDRVDYLDIITKSNDGSDTQITTSVPPSVANGIKFYKGDEPIAWPDMDALGKLIETDSWPPNWDNVLSAYRWKRCKRYA